jgi:hypothetical protein
VPTPPSASVAPAGRPGFVGPLLTIAGVALLVWQVRDKGLDQIWTGFLEVGWKGFLAILALSLVRFTARSLAWVTLLGGRVPLRTATAATISGDALGNLSFLSLLVSEPAKAMYVTRHVPAAEAFAALTAENFFYSVSVASVILGGSITMLARFAVPDSMRGALWLSLAVMALVLGIAVWLARTRPALCAIARRLMVRAPGGRLDQALDRLQHIETQVYAALSTSAWRLWAVVGCEAAFHVASIAEAWLTLTLLLGSASLLNAFLLDTVNRFINVAFRAVPFRVGVDQYTTSSFTELLQLGSTVGVTLSLVRMARLVVWATVGLALLGRRSLAR